MKNVSGYNPLIVSCGDPSGIGYELIIKAWLARQRLKHIPPFVVVGSCEILQLYADLLNLEIKTRSISIDELNRATEDFHHFIPVIETQAKQIFSPGIPKVENAPAIIEAIEKSVQLIKANKASALVTAPIAKKSLYDHGFRFPGHTEFLAHLVEKYYFHQAKSVMLLKSKDFSVVPVTIHIPIRDVAKQLTFDLLYQTIEIVDLYFKKYFMMESPRLALAGLNPHAGEDGAIGDEEINVIIPAIEKARKAGINVTALYPADTMFHDQARQKYDVALCMYHDQALIAIKTLDFENGVNITLGLPFIRTSPDHGTAFDIAGKNFASPNSFINAIIDADEICKNNLKYEQL